MQNCKAHDRKCTNGWNVFGLIMHNISPSQPEMETHIYKDRSVWNKHLFFQGDQLNNR